MTTDGFAEIARLRLPLTRLRTAATVTSLGLLAKAGTPLAELHCRIPPGAALFNALAAFPLRALQNDHSCHVGMNGCGQWLAKRGSALRSLGTLQFATFGHVVALQEHVKADTALRCTVVPSFDQNCFLILEALCALRVTSLSVSTLFHLASEDAFRCLSRMTALTELVATPPAVGSLRALMPHVLALPLRVLNLTNSPRCALAALHVPYCACSVLADLLCPFAVSVAVQRGLHGPGAGRVGRATDEARGA